MDVGGLALATFQVFNTLIKLGLVFATAVRSAKDFGRDAEKLSVNIADEIEKTKQLRALLLDKGKIFPDATLFDQLPTDSQENLVALLYIVTGPLLGECGGVWSTYLAKNQAIEGLEAQGHQDDDQSHDLDMMIKALDDASLSVEYQKNTGLRAKIKWALSDRKKAFDLVQDLSDTTRRIKEDIELFCFPLGILGSKAGLLKADLDAQRLGWSADAGLADLIQNGSTTASGLELQLSDLTEDGENPTGNSCGRSYYRTLPCVVQCKHYQPDEHGEAETEATASIHALSALLKLAGEGDTIRFRLLPFAGFFQDMRRDCFGFVFRYPNNVDDEPPTPLSELLAAEVYDCPLEHRFRLAHTLAKTLSELHRVQWIHKNVNSSNVLYFRNNSSQGHVGIRERSTKAPMEGPWLIGFEHARREDGKTSLATDTRFDRCVYRHPQRWAEPLRSGRIHDIYSLGVVLLEIGLWKPAVTVLTEDLLRAGTNLQRGVASLRLRNKIVDHYRKLCVETLPSSMGTQYGTLVLKCLNGDFNVPSVDAAGVELQKRFWIDVVDVLRKMADSI